MADLTPEEQAAADLAAVRVAEAQATAERELAANFEVVRSHAVNVGIHFANVSEDRKAYWRQQFATLSLGE